MRKLELPEQLFQKIQRLEEYNVPPEAIAEVLGIARSEVDETTPAPAPAPKRPALRRSKERIWQDKVKVKWEEHALFYITDKDAECVITVHRSTEPQKRRVSRRAKPAIAVVGSASYSLKDLLQLDTRQEGAKILTVTLKLDLEPPGMTERGEAVDLPRVKVFFNARFLENRRGRIDS